MEQDTEKSINSGESVERNPDGTFKEGHTKLGGKAFGTRDFSTDFDEVIDDLAKENKITKSEVRKILLRVAYKNAKDGVYQYHKDLHDRVYGQAIQKQEIKADVIVNKESQLITDEAIADYLANVKTTPTDITG